MCTDCNEIKIPVGPQGTPGTNGTNGTNGTDGVKGDTGLTGANGQNGTTILATYNSLTGIGTTPDLSETLFFSYSIPANTLVTNGDELELYCNYSFYSVDNNVPLRIKFGSKILTLNNNALQSTSGFRVVKIKISRISNTSQLWVIEQLARPSSGICQIDFLFNETSTLDLSTILNFEITGQNVSSILPNQLLLKKATLYKYSV